MNYRGKHHGFTIIELLVAMSIATLMGFLINLIFIEVTDAVSRGVATSKVINNSRTLGSQLQSDFEHQFAPNNGNGGVLVIINQTISGAPIMDAVAGGVSTSFRDIRSDQIAFIYDNPIFGDGIYEPITPGSNANFSNGHSGDYVRIWYGHVLKTEGDGTDPASISIGNNVTPDENSFANQWMLGRQALFLDETFPPTVHANGIGPTAPVTGYSAPADINAAITQQLYAGLTDVAYFAYSNAGIAAALANGYLVGPNEDTGDPLRPILADDLAETDYETRALTSLTYYGGYLRCNPFPGGTTFNSSQIAQMHPAFMEGVSDFIVEFAADADGVNGVDRDATTGEIHWYSINGAPGDGGGLPAWDPTWVNPEAAAYTSASTRVWVFRHNEDALWPHLIRFRVRMHDPKGELTDAVDTDTNNDGTVDLSDPNEAWTETGLWFEFIVKVNRS